VLAEAATSRFPTRICREKETFETKRIETYLPVLEPLSIVSLSSRLSHSTVTWYRTVSLLVQSSITDIQYVTSSFEKLVPYDKIQYSIL
jgi:hypothetical protein